jgi:hypothetical protein
MRQKPSKKLASAVTSYRARGMVSRQYNTGVLAKKIKIKNQTPWGTHQIDDL